MNDLLDFIRQGGDLEMPVGLVDRMVAAGYGFPNGTEAAVDALINVILDPTNHDDTNVTAAAALRAQCVFKKS